VKTELSNSRQLWQNPLRKAVEFKRAVLPIMMMMMMMIIIIIMIMMVVVMMMIG
jgi:hypothetical protein